MRWIGACALLALMGGFSATAGPSKVTVCHETGSGDYVEIRVSSKAAMAHLRHGDVLPEEWYADFDGDGYGDPDDSVVACEPPEDYVDDDTDCDDDDARTNPGAYDYPWDGIDRDCDGTPEWGGGGGRL